jgi:predicted acetyltransferase
MTRLAAPDLRFADSWCAAMRESQDAGEGHIHGAGLWNLPEEVWTPADRAACEAVVDVVTANNDPDCPLPEGQVPNELLWIVDGDPEELVGFVSIRFELNDWLFEEGGHVGYSVRPSRRRQGYAGRALALSLERLRERGIERVLVTCDDDNLGSARTIERAGGVQEDLRHGKRRYWIDLA